MSDALVSPPVAAVGLAVAAGLLVVAVAKLRRSPNPPSLALMGMMGAFIFTAQMLNFAIPGTGSSGHVVGGILIAAILGPWAGFLTLSAVIVIQCLVFADGGLLALGCNILNMAAMTCLVAYPLIFRPIIQSTKAPSAWSLSLAATAACLVGLELGAFLVALETFASGITLLPLGKFLMFMLPIHLAIGLCEGIATAALLLFVLKVRPALLFSLSHHSDSHNRPFHGIAVAIGSLFIVAAMIGSAYASSLPDGLEWSLENVLGHNNLPNPGLIHTKADALQRSTAVMPDYENRLSGVAGAGLCVLLAGGVCAAVGRRKIKALPSHSRGPK